VLRITVWIYLNSATFIPFQEGDDAEANILEIARELEEQQNPKQVPYATFHAFLVRCEHYPNA